MEKGKVVNCILRPRGNEPMFIEREDHSIIASLDGYVIIPVEEFEALNSEVQLWKSRTWEQRRRAEAAEGELARLKESMSGPAAPTEELLSLAELDVLEAHWHRNKDNAYFPSSAEDLKLIKMARAYALGQKASGKEGR